MSGASLSAGSAVRVAGQPIEPGPRPAPTDASTPSGFPDLLSKMATAISSAPSRPAISIAERRPTWGKEMSQVVVGTQDEEREGREPALAAVFGSDSEFSADPGDQPSAVPYSLAPP